jgi:hypothetical protein
MDTEQLRYTSGEEIQLGDRVQLAGTYATVVVVSGGESYQTAPGYEDYAGIERGLMICDDDGELMTRSSHGPGPAGARAAVPPGDSVPPVRPPSRPPTRPLGA